MDIIDFGKVERTIIVNKKMISSGNEIGIITFTTEEGDKTIKNVKFIDKNKEKNQVLLSWNDESGREFEGWIDVGRIKWIVTA